MTAVAMRMYGADLLKLRKRWGMLAWALVLALAPVTIYFVVTVIQHATDPANHGPAGGTHAFVDNLRALAVFFGPLSAVMVGVEAGTGDFGAGVFRDLVVTGRSRLALFASRIPAALTVCWAIVTGGYAIALACVFAFAGGLPTPDAATLLNGYGFMLLSTGAVCAVAVGFSSLTTSKPASITALIGWQLVASPLIAQIDSLGAGRKGLLTLALSHFSPVDPGRRSGEVPMSGTVALVVIAAWICVFLALGAWRTRRVDA